MRCLPLVLLAACAAPVQEAPAAVWLDAAHPLAAAQDAWGLPLPFAPALVELGGSDVDAACDVVDPAPGTGALGCVRGEAIYLRAGLDPSQRARVLRHELGHVYAGPGHMPESDECPAPEPSGRVVHGVHTMCAGSSDEGWPTAGDLDWVLAR